MVMTTAAVIGAAGCSKQEGPGTRAGGPESQSIEVQFTPVKAIQVERTIPIEGTLMAVEEARISSEVSGFVESLDVDLGDIVKQGQVLVIVNPREFQLNVDKAEASLRQTEAQLGNLGGQDHDPKDDTQRTMVRQAKANLDDAATNLAQAEKLREQGLISQQELNTAQTKFKVQEALYQGALESVHGLRATLQERRASLELARKKLVDTQIRASIDGMAKERLISKGDYIRENTPVITIVRMNPLRVRLSLPEKYAGQVKEEMPVRFNVEAYTGEIFSGRIVNLSPTIDPATRTFIAEADVANPDMRLKPGFFLKGWVITDPNAVTLAIPREALVTYAGVKKVFLLNGDKIHESQVQPGIEKDDWIEIITGVKEGDKVAVSSINHLAEGVRVHEAGAAKSGEPAEPGPGDPPRKRRPAGS